MGARRPTFISSLPFQTKDGNVAVSLRTSYKSYMGTPVNLADPDIEPSDEQLEGLMHRAFANIADGHEASLRAMRARIAAAQVEMLRTLETDLARSGI